MFLLLSCASQAPPSGGPPDRTPPEVAQTWPAPDATHIAPGQEVRIRFSEAMDRRSAEESFFLSPAPGRLKFRWIGDEMEVLPAEGFHPGRTYLVSVGTGSRDEAGNPLRASYDFAFSTGDRIDRGEIRGRVLPLDGGRSQVYVVVYELTGRGDPDPASDAPDYTTQAASDGAFRFPRLSPGRYRAFAFEDRDRDRSYSPGVDPLSVPPADALLTEPDAVALLGDLRSALRDTARATLTSARAVDRTHVALRFSRPVAGPIDAALSGPSGPLSVLAVHLDPADRALLLTGAQTPGGTYRIERLSGPEAVGLPREMETFKGSGDPDRTPPRIAALRPKVGAEQVWPDAPVEIVFSEPMRTAGVSPAWITSDTTEAPSGTFRWSAPDRLTFTPASPWAPARLHRLVGDGRDLTDPAGNRLSGDVALSFTTLDSSRLGGIAGRISVPEGAPPGRLCLRAVRVGDPKAEATATLPQPGAYALSGLPPGRYDVSGFLDLNGDGGWTAGRPRPFLPSEPFGSLPEPVDVRPRWTTDGVEIRIEIVRYVKE